MTSNEKVLLNLLQSAVSVKVPNGDLLLDNADDWKKIFGISAHQGVNTVLLDAIEHLQDNLRPKNPLLMRWVGQTMMQEQTYEHHKAQITLLADILSKHDIQILLLKGYGCSLNYPVPRHRPTGDIDIYLFGKQANADRIVEQELGIKVHREYHKHSTFDFNGVEVENHAKFIDDMSHKSNIRFEQVLMQTLTQYPCIKSPIANVLLPSPTFNALFLLRHTGEHFASNEITLRHILDVGTFFRRFHSEIDWNFVFGEYKQERMMDFFNGIATICVSHLGFSPDCFTSDDKSYSYKIELALADRILEDIFIKKKQLPMSTNNIKTIWQKYTYMLEKSSRWWHNRWKYKLIYNENLIESFIWLAKNRLKNF